MEEIPGTRMGASTSRPRRICVDGVSTVLAGGVTYMSCLVNALARAAPCWTFDVVVSTGPLADKLDRLPNIRLHRAAWARGGAARFVYRQTALVALADRLRADALLVQFPGLLLADRPQVMIAMNSHYVMEPPVAPDARSRFYRRVQRFLFSVGYRHCQRTVFVSEQMAQLGRRFVGRDRTRGVVIYEAASPVMHRLAASVPPYAERKVEPYLLAVGTVASHKNYAVMVRAYGELARRLPDCPRLKIAGYFGALDAFRRGAGPRPALLDLAEREGVADRIDFLGSVSDEELGALFSRCLAFVSTSLLEAFNLTVVEAMAFGVPLLVPDTSAYPEQCGDSVLYADPSDPKSVAEQMYRLATDRDLREEYARRASERGRLYSWERSAEQYLRVLEDIARPRASSC